MQRVLDRERKWLRRKTAAGRCKRRWEYQAAVRRGGQAGVDRHAPAPQPAAAAAVDGAPHRDLRSSNYRSREVSGGIFVAALRRSPPMIEKRLLVPDRVRRPPREGFSWIDRRFLHEYAARLSGEAVFLYLFLAAVSDQHGLSFYRDTTIAVRLRMQRAGGGPGPRGIGDATTWWPTSRR